MKPNGNILILCAKNSARSQMAEALFRKHCGTRFDVYSAGLEASEIHPLAARVMEEIGLPLTEQRSKDAREYLGRLTVHHLVVVAPIVGLLVAATSNLHVPFAVLLYSVVAFIVIPLVLGSLSRFFPIRAKGRNWFESVYLPFFHPVTTVALLATLVLILAFQANNLTRHFVHVLLIAVPILIQVYFDSGLVYDPMRLFEILHSVAAPGALIGASNFFELAVAVAITLFGADSGAALATVVGVLVEVPVMLSVCAFCNRTRHWFTEPAVVSSASTS
jgi:ACR3 family arsenite transporter